MRRGNKGGKAGRSAHGSAPAAAAQCCHDADAHVCVGGEKTSSLSSGSLTAAQIPQSRNRADSPHPVVFAIYLSQ